MKLRLLLLKECNRRCKGCCNKGFDLDALPVCKDFTGFSEIIITGGEPLLQPTRLLALVKQIRNQTAAPIYLYTAFREDPRLLACVLHYIDGVTLTLHTKKDVEPFKQLNDLVPAEKSLRLNVFHGIGLGDVDLSKWKVKRNIRWIKDCPLPIDEVFMRI